MRDEKATHVTTQRDDATQPLEAEIEAYEQAILEFVEEADKLGIDVSGAEFPAPRSPSGRYKLVRTH